MNKATQIILAGIALATVLTISHALLRASSGGPTTELASLWKVFLALFLYALVFFCYTWLLRHFQISSLYPVYTGLSIVGVALTGILYFGETWSPNKIGGIALVIFGVWLVSES
jgi:multidrug transporter EmrE-like cation transporter